MTSRLRGSGSSHESTFKVQGHPNTLRVLLGVFLEIEPIHFELISITDIVLKNVGSIPAAQNDTLAVSFLFAQRYFLAAMAAASLCSINCSISINMALGMPFMG